MTAEESTLAFQRKKAQNRTEDDCENTYGEAEDVPHSLQP